MSRYIDADSFFEEFEELDREPYNNYPTADVVEVGKEYLFKDAYQVIASTEGYFVIERVDSKHDNSELVLKRDGKFDCWNC